MRGLNLFRSRFGINYILKLEAPELLGRFFVV